MKIFKFLGRWVLRFATLIGLAVLCLSIIGALSLRDMWTSESEFKPLPDNSTLVLKIDSALPEIPSRSYFDQFIGVSTVSLYDFLRVLDHAKTDNRIQTLAVRIQDGDYSITQIEAMRNAIVDFRSTGKKTVAYATSFGDFSNGIGEYWLASAFETIIVQPAGQVSLNGIYIEQPFIKETLDKIGVEAQIYQRKEYKTAPETYTRTGMSEESKETLVAIAEGMMKVIVRDIAQARNLEIGEVAAAIHSSPLAVDQALEMRLIDAISFSDEVEENYIETPVSFMRYKNRLDRDEDKAAVAYIPVMGAILEEQPVIQSAPKAFIFPEDIAEASDVAIDIMAAADDEDIKVILLSINSPGGSPTAAETIRRAVVYARNQGKYVIAAMGDVAASGGYWLATHANQIIASDLTITGSIGVYGGKPNLQGLWDKWGVQWDAVKIGRNAGMWTPNKPYDPQEIDRIQAMMDQVYNDFTSRVADGRNLPADRVEAVAKGRAWIGSDAREKGLVDLNGAFDFALKRAAAEAGGLNWSTMNFWNMAQSKDPLEELLDMIGMPIGAGIQIPSSYIGLLTPQAVVMTPDLSVQF
jgi:protease-4